MKLDLYHAHIQKKILRKQKLDLITSSLKSIKGHYQESEKTKSSTNGAVLTGHPNEKKKKNESRQRPQLNSKWITNLKVKCKTI